MTSENIKPSTMEYPEFKSALSYTQVRDFAYPDFHPLHYGVPLRSSQATEEYEEEEDESNRGQGLEDGPPWQEDPDLSSPVVTSHEYGDRISKQYEFSVASADEIHGRAIALFDFSPENDNEAPLREGQIIWISYRHGQGWLVAEDPASGETGLVPEEYVQLLGHASNDNEAEPLGQVCLSPESEGWIDEGEAIEDDDTTEKLKKQLENDSEEALEKINQLQLKGD
jgi:hypothetical protein